MSLGLSLAFSVSLLVSCMVSISLAHSLLICLSRWLFLSLSSPHLLLDSCIASFLLTHCLSPSFSIFLFFSICLSLSLWVSLSFSVPLCFSLSSSLPLPYSCLFLVCELHFVHQSPTIPPDWEGVKIANESVFISACYLCSPPGPRTPGPLFREWEGVRARPSELVASRGQSQLHQFLISTRGQFPEVRLSAFNRLSRLVL